MSSGKGVGTGLTLFPHHINLPQAAFTVGSGCGSALMSGYPVSRAGVGIGFDQFPLRISNRTAPGKAGRLMGMGLIPVTLRSMLGMGNCLAVTASAVSRASGMLMGNRFGITPSAGGRISLVLMLNGPGIAAASRIRASYMSVENIRSHRL